MGGKQEKTRKQRRAKSKAKKETKTKLEVGKVTQNSESTGMLCKG